MILAVVDATVAPETTWFQEAGVRHPTFLSVGGQTLLRRTLWELTMCSSVGKVVVVGHPDLLNDANFGCEVYSAEADELDLRLEMLTREFPRSRLLLVPPNLPFARYWHYDTFICAAEYRNCDIAHGCVRDSLMRSCYPEFAWDFEGGVRGNGLQLLHSEALRRTILDNVQDIHCLPELGFQIHGMQDWMNALQIVEQGNYLAAKIRIS